MIASNQSRNIQVSPFFVSSDLPARLGQCFSTTRPVVDVDVVEIPDVEYNGYCFSDGVYFDLFVFLLTFSKVGKISESLAELVTNAIGYDPVPTLINNEY